MASGLSVCAVHAYGLMLEFSSVGLNSWPEESSSLKSSVVLTVPPGLVLGPQENAKPEVVAREILGVLQAGEVLDIDRVERIDLT